MKKYTDFYSGRHHCPAGRRTGRCAGIHEQPAAAATRLPATGGDQAHGA